MGHELVREARTEHLPALLNHIQRTCGRLDADVLADLTLAVEEVCVNIIKHGYAGGPPGPIRLSCRREDDRVEVTVTDEATPFNPAGVPPPDLVSDWTDRPVGGLGWHLVRQSVDEVRYEPLGGGGNRVTLVKALRSPPPHP